MGPLTKFIGWSSDILPIVESRKCVISINRLQVIWQFACYLTGAAVSFKRMSGLVVRSEGKAEPGSGAGRNNAPTSPTSPPGLSGTEIPLSVITSSAPLAQGTDKPVAERIAYICQDCGYVYDQETPFEDVPDEYNCPRTFISNLQVTFI